MSNQFFEFDNYIIPSDGIPVNEARQQSESLVLIYKEDYDTFSELCHKIFSAVGLELNGYPGLILLEKGTEINIAKHSSEHTKYVISFGIAPTKLGLNGKFNAYRIYQTATFKLMMSHSLNKLSESKERKKALWESLKLQYTPDLNQ